MITTNTLDKWTSRLLQEEQARTTEPTAAEQPLREEPTRLAKPKLSEEEGYNVMFQKPVDYLEGVPLSEGRKGFIKRGVSGLWAGLQQGVFSEVDFIDKVADLVGKAVGVDNVPVEVLSNWIKPEDIDPDDLGLYDKIMRGLGQAMPTILAIGAGGAGLARLGVKGAIKGIKVATPLAFGAYSGAHEAVSPEATLGSVAAETAKGIGMGTALGAIHKVPFITKHPVTVKAPAVGGLFAGVEAGEKAIRREPITIEDLAASFGVGVGLTVPYVKLAKKGIGLFREKPPTEPTPTEPTPTEPIEPTQVKLPLTTTKPIEGMDLPLRERVSLTEDVEPIGKEVKGLVRPLPEIKGETDIKILSSALHQDKLTTFIKNNPIERYTAITKEAKRIDISGKTLSEDGRSVIPLDLTKPIPISDIFSLDKGDKNVWRAEPHKRELAAKAAEREKGLSEDVQKKIKNDKSSYPRDIKILKGEGFNPISIKDANIRELLLNDNLTPKDVQISKEGKITPLTDKGAKALGKYLQTIVISSTGEEIPIEPFPFGKAEYIREVKPAIVEGLAKNSIEATNMGGKLTKEQAADLWRTYKAEEVSIRNDRQAGVSPEALTQRIHNNQMRAEMVDGFITKGKETGKSQTREQREKAVGEKEVPITAIPEAKPPIEIKLSIADEKLGRMLSTAIRDRAEKKGELKLVKTITKGRNVEQLQRIAKDVETELKTGERVDNTELYKKLGLSAEQIAREEQVRQLTKDLSEPLKVVPKSEVNKSMINAIKEFKKAGLPITEPMRVEMRKLAERDPEAFVNLVTESTTQKVAPVPEEIMRAGRPKFEVIEGAKEAPVVLAPEPGKAVSVEELARRGVNYAVDKAGNIEHLGKSVDLPPGKEAVLALLPDGRVEVRSTRPDLSFELALEKYGPRVRARYEEIKVADEKGQLDKEGFPISEEALRKPVLPEKPIPTKGITEEMVDDFTRRYVVPEEKVEPIASDKVASTDKVKVARPVIQDLERQIEEFGFDVKQPEVSKRTSLAKITTLAKTIEKLEGQKPSLTREGNLKATYEKLASFRTGETLSPDQLKKFGKTATLLNETIKAREKFLSQIPEKLKKGEKVILNTIEVEESVIPLGDYWAKLGLQKTLKPKDLFSEVNRRKGFVSMTAGEKDTYIIRVFRDVPAKSEHNKLGRRLRELETIDKIVKARKIDKPAVQDLRNEITKIKDDLKHVKRGDKGEYPIVGLGVLEKIPEGWRFKDWQTQLEGKAEDGFIRTTEGSVKDFLNERGDYTFIETTEPLKAPKDFKPSYGDLGEYKPIVKEPKAKAPTKRVKIDDLFDTRADNALDKLVLNTLTEGEVQSLGALQNKFKADLLSVLKVKETNPTRLKVMEIQENRLKGKSELKEQIPVMDKLENVVIANRFAKEALEIETDPVKLDSIKNDITKQGEVIRGIVEFAKGKNFKGEEHLIEADRLIEGFNRAKAEAGIIEEMKMGGRSVDYKEYDPSIRERMNADAKKMYQGFAGGFWAGIDRFGKTRKLKKTLPPEEMKEYMKENWDYSRRGLDSETTRALMNTSPVELEKTSMAPTDLLSQTSQAKNPDVRYLARVIQRENFSRNVQLKQLVSEKGWIDEKGTTHKSLIQEIEALLNKSSEDKPREAMSDHFIKGTEGKDAPMREAMSKWRKFAEGVADINDLKKLGVYVTNYFPLIRDAQGTYTKLRGQFLKYKNVEDLPDTLWGIKQEPELFARIQDIMRRRTIWEKPKEGKVSPANTLTAFERAQIQKHVMGERGIYLQFEDVPFEIRDAAKIVKEKFNPHMQERIEPINVGAIKHDAIDVIKQYIYTWTNVNRKNEILKDASAVLRKYPDRHRFMSVRWFMEKMVDAAMGKSTPGEQAVGRLVDFANQRQSIITLDPKYGSELASNITTGITRGVFGVDTAIRNIPQQIAAIVDLGGKSYFKGLMKFITNRGDISPEFKERLEGKPFTERFMAKGLGEKAYHYWDLVELSREHMENVPTKTGPLRERLKAAPTKLGKTFAFYNWVGDKALGPFHFTENLNKSITFLASLEQAKERGFSLDTAMHRALKTMSTTVIPMVVPDAYSKAYYDVGRSQYLYSQPHKSPLLRGPIARLSTLFWSYPANTIQFMSRGLQDSWYQGDYMRFTRFMLYFGFQLSIASALANVGLDVANIFGAGILPVAPLTLPWQIIYNTYNGIAAPTEGDRDKAIDAALTGLGNVFIPGFRYGKKVLKGIKNLEEGYRETPKGDLLMETSPITEMLDWMGFPPIIPRETWDLINQGRDLTYEQGKKKNEYIQKAVKSIEEGKGDLGSIIREAREKGIPLSYRDIYPMIDQKTRKTLLEKRLESMPKNIRARVMREALELQQAAFPTRGSKKPIRNLWSQYSEFEED